jgi:hypothetical protein
VSIRIDLDPMPLTALQQSAEKANKPVRDVAKDVLEVIFQGRASFVAIEPPPTAEQLNKIKEFIAETMGYQKVQDGNPLPTTEPV